MRLFFTRRFVSERKQISLIADEKSPARISHRSFATKSLRNEENAKISITYEGVTYSQANTTLGNLALGGRTSVSLQGNEVEMTFEVVGIKKYGDVSLSGYYKGAVTVIE